LPDIFLPADDEDKSTIPRLFSLFRKGFPVVFVNFCIFHKIPSRGNFFM